MLIIRKDQIEHAATRLLTQAQVNAEAAPKVFEEYVKIRYPYLETAKKREHDDAIKQLIAEVNKGPLTITPMGDPAVKSRLHKKVEKADVLPASSSGKVSSRLLSKIGKAVPL
jgi:hypothetical protein